MSHPAQIDFVKRVKNENPDFFENKKVIEIGSLDINGTVRNFFTDCEYVGVDVDEGPHVDLVCLGQEVDHANNTYDVSCSCNCFEHNPYWVETFENMHRMTREGGLVFVSVPTTGCPEHGTHGYKPEDSPLTIKRGWNYYKNLTEQDYRDNFNLDEMFSSYKFEEVHIQRPEAHDIYFYGFKK